MKYGDGDWGLGIGDWGLGPIPNPQSPNPKTQTPKNPTTHYITKKQKIITNTIKKYH